jgi:hypothetical protein
MPNILLQIAIVWIISIAATRFVTRIKGTASKVISTCPSSFEIDGDHHSDGTASSSTTGPSGDSRSRSSSTASLLSSLSSYPNPIGITSEMRERFHPVIIMKNAIKQQQEELWEDCNMTKVVVLDLTQESGHANLIAKDDQESFIQRRTTERRMKDSSDKQPCFTIGKYDENRMKLYSSELFQDSDNSISGYDGARTLHVGIDLGAPVGVNVYSFWDGVVHSVGYNPDLGDYGYVIVVEYELSDLKRETLQEEKNTSQAFQEESRTGSSSSCHGRNDNDKDEGDKMRSMRFWALYGHLDSSTVERNQVGQKIKRGDILGRIGDVDENGGW